MADPSRNDDGLMLPRGLLLLDVRQKSAVWSADCDPLHTGVHPALTRRHETSLRREHPLLR